MKRTFRDAHTARKWALGFLALLFIGVPLIGRDLFVAEGSRLWVLWYGAALVAGALAWRERRASNTNGNNT